MAYSKRSRTKTNSRLSTSSRHVAVISKTNQHLYVTIVSPAKQVITQCGTPKLVRSGKVALGSNILAAKELAKSAAEKLKELKVSSLSFNRRGWPYLGRIKAFVEQLRLLGVTV